MYDDGAAATTFTSSDSVSPNQNNGLPLASNGNAGVAWNAVGGGYNRFGSNFSEGIHWVNLPPIAYLNNPADVATVFAVSPRI